MKAAEKTATAKTRSRTAGDLAPVTSAPAALAGRSMPESLAAEAGVPTGFMPMPMSCATAPATLAGNLVVTTVDSLSPLVLLLL